MYSQDESAFFLIIPTFPYLPISGGKSALHFRVEETGKKAAEHLLAYRIEE